MSRPVWRQRDFGLLWAGQTVSEIGSQVTTLAFPTLAVLTLHAEAVAVGMLIAAQRLAFPVLSLFAGVFVDRARKRPIMIACNTGRFLILVAIPLLAATGDLALWHLFAASAGMGVFSVFFDIAYMAYVPSLVGGTDLLDANSKLETSMSAAALVGPGIGGVLVQLLTAARAVLADAASFLFSAITLLSIRHVEEKPSSTERRMMFREIGQGLGHVFRHPVLRAQILCMGAAGLFAHMIEGPIYLFAYNSVHISPGELGIYFACEGLGALGGSFVARAIAQAVGPGRAIVIFDGGAMLLSALLPLALIAPPFLVLPPVFFAIGIAATVGNVTQWTLRQTLSPVGMQGRMTAVFRTIFWGSWPIGNLLGGVAAAAVGVVPTIIAASVLGFLVNSSIIFTPLWRVRAFGSSLTGVSAGP